MHMVSAAVADRVRKSAVKVGAIVVAAGESRRMRGVDKVLAPILGRPLVSYSIAALSDTPAVGAIVLVVSRDMVAQARRLVKENGWLKVRAVCAGGGRRQDSVRQGLTRVQETDWVIVHDAARPCVAPEVFELGLEQARATGAAVAAVPVNDTIKSATLDMTVTSTLSRDGLWYVQTPQVFRTDLLCEAHRRVLEDVTDDALMIERIGGSVKLFMGSYQNIKVTTPEDLAIVEGVLRARAVESSEGERSRPVQA